MPPLQPWLSKMVVADWITGTMASKMAIKMADTMENKRENKIADKMIVANTTAVMIVKKTMSTRLFNYLKDLYIQGIVRLLCSTCISMEYTRTRKT